MRVVFAVTCATAIMGGTVYAQQTPASDQDYLKRVATAAPPQIVEQATVVRMDGSTMQTLTHLVDADERYLQRLTTPTVPSREDADTRPLADLRTEMREHGDRWAGMLDALDRDDLHAAVIGKSDYPDTDPAEGMLLVQAIQHGNDHRTQICSTLGALGLDVPDLDAWEYWATQRR